MNFLSQTVKYNSQVVATTLFFCEAFIIFSFCLRFSSSALLSGLLLELPVLLLFCAQPPAADLCMLPECCKLCLVLHLTMPGQKQTAILPYSTHQSWFYHKQLHPSCSVSLCDSINTRRVSLLFFFFFLTWMFIDFSKKTAICQYFPHKEEKVQKNPV